jgi:internalin A
LTHLDISDNKLRKIPDELGYLVNLTYLNLSKNQLSEVPDTLEMLRYLTDLDLSQNRLKAIPRVLGRHENLKRLYISSNPAMRFPPPEVIDQGTGAILTYLRLQVDENNSVRQWIFKVTRSW